MFALSFSLCVTQASKALVFAEPPSDTAASSSMSSPVKSGLDGHRPTTTSSCPNRRISSSKHNKFETSNWSREIASLTTSTMFWCSRTTELWEFTPLCLTRCKWYPHRSLVLSLTEVKNSSAALGPVNPQSSNEDCRRSGKASELSLLPIPVIAQSS